ncbi:M16 family metallopeptidase [Ruixingdingia sedimenti]|uniref:Pitrilysin family protein n=1 Tax=Ruixingdingia sedimenti TaxID=3073604 RepID=A0ABU1F6T7_9RHOB|nr:pitrilysin family protein [Xinfangfangia sp. LG-4]MDR5652591.1 pitrilysin family protein [Xinfangfangia sp. LG-4]
MNRFLALVAAATIWSLPVQAEIPITEVKSPGGITAWLVESHDIPFVALELRFRGGGSLDTPEKAGAVNLMAGLLEEGAGDLDARGFAEARDALAADFRFSAGTDAVAVSARFLTESRADAVTLLRSALTEPRFDADAVERVRGQVLSSLRSAEKDPGTLASRAFDALAFGAHPYALPLDGTLETVPALTRDDIAAAHRGALARDRVHVAAVGDIGPEELGRLLDDLLSGLPETGAPLPGPATVDLTRGITVQEFLGPQSVIIFGHEGIPRHDPDFIPAYVANEILGGGRFSARLMREVRDRRGLTYGVGSYLYTLASADLAMGQLSTANATAGAAIEVVRAEWDRIAEEGVTAEELEATKTYLTGSYPLRFDGNAPIARILVGLQLLGYPIDYPAARNAMVEAVTLEDVNRAARRLFRPDNLRFVVVGAPEGLPQD